MFQDLAGRTAILTGGGRGLGYSLATALARHGVDVRLLDILPQVGDSAEALSADHEIRSLGVDADVTDAASVEAAYQGVRDELGTPTILNNLAARPDERPRPRTQRPLASDRGPSTPAHRWIEA